MVETIKLKEMKKQQARMLIEAAKAMMKAADAFLNMSPEDIKKIQEVAADDDELIELQSELENTVEAIRRYV